jgi:hypothetical protein
MSLEPVPRETVHWFGREMEATLRKNDHKGGWEREAPDSLFHRIYDEWQELGKALVGWHEGTAGTEAIIAEAVDVANFAMFIADLAQKTVR